MPPPSVSAASDANRAEYAALVRAAASGDPDAMDRLLARAQDPAYRYSLLVCGHTEDAEDVMQDALLKTYRHVGQIGDPGAFRTWLFTTVRNACLMKRRRHVGEPAHLVSLDEPTVSGEGESAAMEVPDEQSAPDRLFLASWLRAALDTLPASYRVMVILRDLEGFSTREVAAVTGISEANVKTRLHRARQMLRRAVSSGIMPPS